MGFLINLLQSFQQEPCECDLVQGCFCSPEGVEDHSGLAPCYVCGEWYAEDVYCRDEDTMELYKVDGRSWHERGGASLRHQVGETRVRQWLDQVVVPIASATWPQPQYYQQYQQQYQPTKEQQQQQHHHHHQQQQQQQQEEEKGHKQQQQKQTQPIRSRPSRSASCSTIFSIPEEILDPTTRSPGFRIRRRETIATERPATLSQGHTCEDTPSLPSASASAPTSASSTLMNTGSNSIGSRTTRSNSFRFSFTSERFNTAIQESLSRRPSTSASTSTTALESIVPQSPPSLSAETLPSKDIDSSTTTPSRANVAEAAAGETTAATEAESGMEEEETPPSTSAQSMTTTTFPPSPSVSSSSSSRGCSSSSLDKVAQQCFSTSTKARTFGKTDEELSLAQAVVQGQSEGEEQDTGQDQGQGQGQIRQAAQPCCRNNRVMGSSYQQPLQQQKYQYQQQRYPCQQRYQQHQYQKESETGETSDPMVTATMSFIPSNPPSSPSLPSCSVSPPRALLSSLPSRRQGLAPSVSLPPQMQTQTQRQPQTQTPPASQPFLPLTLPLSSPLPRIIITPPSPTRPTAILPHCPPSSLSSSTFTPATGAARQWRSCYDTQKSFLTNDDNDNNDCDHDVTVVDPRHTVDSSSSSPPETRTATAGSAWPPVLHSWLDFSQSSIKKSRWRAIFRPALAHGWRRLASSLISREQV